MNGDEVAGIFLQGTDPDSTRAFSLLPF